MQRLFHSSPSSPSGFDFSKTTHNTTKKQKNETEKWLLKIWLSMVLRGGEMET
jgi:hypothetical protein